MMKMKDHHMYYKPTNHDTQPLTLVLDPEVADLIDLFEKPFEAPRQIKGRRKLVEMENSDWYNNDNLGLKTLRKADRVKFLHMPGGHDKFSVLEAQIMFVPALNL
jgi:hypothetical protein